VPEVLYVNPDESDGLPPFTLARFVDGVSFHQLKKTGDREAIAQAAHSAGETLAAIGRIRFDKAGWLGPGRAVGSPLPGAGCPLPPFVDLCLAAPRLEQRVPPEWRSRVHDLLWRWEPELDALSHDPRLVQGDFNRRNLLVQSVKGRWQVAAVLDWEFALSGSPLADVGTFLRYEKDFAPLAEPHFSNGYRAAGGQLPEHWRSLARCLSLAAICESLTHDDLPPAIALELVDLLIANCL
jgi:aminoglycoside phosphotransferase (APT) family kinase protein